MPGKGLVVAEVVGVRVHPNGDLIRLADVHTGDGQPTQVVFGGSRNPDLGALVAYAPPGSRLHTGEKMRRRQYRGEASYGMLCSTMELGWMAEGPDEIAVLRPGKTPGQSLDNVVLGNEWLDDRSRLSHAQMRYGVANPRSRFQFCMTNIKADDLSRAFLTLRESELDFDRCEVPITDVWFSPPDLFSSTSLSIP